MASPRPDPLRRFDALFAPFTWCVAAFAVIVLFAGPELIGAARTVARPVAAGTPGAQATAAAAPAAASSSGEQVFVSAGCGSCHTLAAAKATGAIGPNLDDLKPDAATVAAKVTAGGGSMPAFKSSLSPEQIDAVAKYVADSAGA
jgi:mono/diheme cytochrome c family protein